MGTTVVIQNSYVGLLFELLHRCPHDLAYEQPSHPLVVDVGVRPVMEIAREIEQRSASFPKRGAMMPLVVNLIHGLPPLLGGGIRTALRLFLVCFVTVPQHKLDVREPYAYCIPQADGVGLAGRNARRGTPRKVRIRGVPSSQSVAFPEATVAQWQSSCFVNSRSTVQIRSVAP